jgi:hypothetical protein
MGMVIRSAMTRPPVYVGLQMITKQRIPRTSAEA